MRSSSFSISVNYNPRLSTFQDYSRPFDIFQKPDTKDLPAPYEASPQARASTLRTIEKLEPRLTCAVDPFSTNKPDGKPIVVTYMHMSKGEFPMPLMPVYECDEAGVVVVRLLTVEDESGVCNELKAGDSFLLTKGAR